MRLFQPVADDLIDLRAYFEVAQYCVGPGARSSAAAGISVVSTRRREAMIPPLPLDVPKKEPYTHLSAPTLLDVIEVTCARGFVRQATRLTLTSRKIAAACPMGTGAQIWEAAKVRVRVRVRLG